MLLSLLRWSLYCSFSLVYCSATSSWRWHTRTTGSGGSQACEEYGNGNGTGPGTLQFTIVKNEGARERWRWYDGDAPTTTKTMVMVTSSTMIYNRNGSWFGVNWSRADWVMPFWFFDKIWTINSTTIKHVWHTDTTPTTAPTTTKTMVMVMVTSSTMICNRNGS